MVLFHMCGELTHHGFHPVQPQFQNLVHALNLGRRGVQLFFVISGFIVGLPFAGHFFKAQPGVQLRRYFVRRITRLQPPYVFNLLISAVLLQIAWHPGLKQVAIHLLAAIVYLDFLVLHAQGGLPVSGVAWTLEVEIQFYLIAPLLAGALFRVKKAWLRRALLLALMLGSAVLQQNAQLSQGTVLAQMQYFLGGLLLADLHVNVSMHKHQSLWWDLVSLAGWPLVFWITRQAGYWLAPLAVLLVLGAMRGRIFRALFRTPAVALAGGISYTVYLWHLIALSLTQRLLAPLDLYLPLNYGAYFLIQGALKTLVIATVSLPMFLLIERPCMDPHWPTKLFERLRGPREHDLPTERTPSDRAHNLAA